MLRRDFLKGSTLALAPFGLIRPAEADIPLISHDGFAKTHTPRSDMFWNWRRVQQFTIALRAERRAPLRLHFNASLKLADDRERMSVYAISAGLRGPAPANEWPGTDDPFWGRPPEIPGCFVRANILPSLVTQPTGGGDRHKYATPSFSTIHQIEEPGFYRVEIWARARSSAYMGQATNYDETGTPNPGGDGNVQFDLDPYDAYLGTQPQNQLVVELD